MKKYLARGFAVDEGRLIKAKKIEAVLLDYLQERHSVLSGRKIIDIGSGSGQIAAYFSDQNQVWAADIVDQVSEEVKDKIHFSEMKDGNLLLSDGQFDIAILNHVIAHTSNKRKLLSEVHRILKPGGLCYIANPNRLFPTEPCYKIPILHYLPDRYFIKLAKRLTGYHEDVFLVSGLSLKKLVLNCGFKLADYTVKIVNEPGKYFSEYHLPGALKMPDFLSIMSPTNVFILQKITQ